LKLEGDRNDAEEAWGAFASMEATDWRFLPYAGGLMDQPELVMRNLYRIKALSNALRERNREK
jgi:hypothetical protein